MADVSGVAQHSRVSVWVTRGATMDGGETNERKRIRDNAVPMLDMVCASECVARRKATKKGALLRIDCVKSRHSIIDELGDRHEDGTYPEWTKTAVQRKFDNVADARDTMASEYSKKGVCLAWDLPGAGGAKNYFIGPFKSVYRLFCERGDPREIQRCYYEMMTCEPRKTHVNMYADIDPHLPPGLSPEEETNARQAYLEKESRFLDLFRTYVCEQFGVSSEDVVERVMDSSRKGRISRHVVWYIKGVMFLDVLSAGAFMKTFELDVIQQGGLCPAGDLSNEWYDHDPDNPHTMPEYFGDNSVFNTGRAMRGIGSNKDGKPHTLRPTEKGEFPSDGNILARDYTPTMREVRQNSIVYPPPERECMAPPRKVQRNGEDDTRSSGIYIVAVAMPHGSKAGEEGASSNSLTDHWFDRERWGVLGQSKKKRENRVKTNAPKLEKNMAIDDITAKTGTRDSRDLSITPAHEALHALSELYLDVASHAIVYIREFAEECRGQGDDGGADVLTKKAEEWCKLLKPQKKSTDNGNYIAGCKLQYDVSSRELTVKNRLQLCPSRSFSRTVKEYCHKSENSYLVVRIGKDSTGTPCVEGRMSCFTNGKHPALDTEENKHACNITSWRRLPIEWTSVEKTREVLLEFKGLELTQEQILYTLMDALNTGGVLHKQRQ